MEEETINYANEAAEQDFKEGAGQSDKKGEVFSELDQGEEKRQEGKDYSDILQGNAMSVEDIEEKKKGGLLWIKARQDELVETWQKRFPQAGYTGSDMGLILTQEQLKILAYEWADLENDFNFIRDVSQYTGSRYAEFMGVLPSLEEMDLLLCAVELMPIIPDPEHSRTQIENLPTEFFRIGTKEERIVKLKKLKALVKANLA